jgi:hypothetical protein
VQSIAEILEHEADAPAAREDERLEGFLVAIEKMQAAITRTLIKLADAPANGG